MDFETESYIAIMIEHQVDRWFDLSEEVRFFLERFVIEAFRARLDEPEAQKLGLATGSVSFQLAHAALDADGGIGESLRALVDGAQARARKRGPLADELLLIDLLAEAHSRWGEIWPFGRSSE